MIKKLLPPFIIFSISILFYQMVLQTIKSTLFSQQKISNLSNDPFLQKLLSFLTTKDINNLKIKYQKEIAQLAVLQKSSLCLTALSTIWFILIFIKKPNFSIKKFDGLTVLLSYLLTTCFIFTLFEVFRNDFFENGSNAIINISITTSIILLIFSPVVFFVSYKLNNYEFKHQLHQSKWISLVAISLMILTALLALLFSIGCLITPDLSSFTN